VLFAHFWVPWDRAGLWRAVGVAVAFGGMALVALGLALIVRR